MRKIDDFEISILAVVCVVCLVIGILLGAVAGNAARAQQERHNQTIRTHPQFRLEPATATETKLLVCQDSDLRTWFSVNSVDPKLTSGVPLAIEIQSADKRLSLRLEPDQTTDTVNVTVSRPDGETKTFTVTGPVQVKVRQSDGAK
jgi:heme/copper-type cytochrome/quinol oxidase subunit 2